MADKLWQGADSFDLDGDHLPGVTDRDFPGMLSVIHEQAWSLWNDYLEPEFGFLKSTSSDILRSSGFICTIATRSFHLDSEARRTGLPH